MQHQIVGTERLGFLADIGAKENDRLSSRDRAAFPCGARIGVGTVHAGDQHVAPFNAGDIGIEDRARGRSALLAFLRKKELRDRIRAAMLRARR